MLIFSNIGFNTEGFTKETEIEKLCAQTGCNKLTIIIKTSNISIVIFLFSIAHLTERNKKLFTGRTVGVLTGRFPRRVSARYLTTYLVIHNMDHQ